MSALKSFNFRNCLKLFMMSLMGVLISCGSLSEKMERTSNTKIIEFGKGGGFTGKFYDYQIHETGDLYRLENEKSILCGKAPQNISVQVFDNYDKLNLEKTELNNPGNIYYYLRMQKGGVRQHEIIWSGNAPVQKELTAYFSVLMDIVKKYSNSVPPIK